VRQYLYLAFRVCPGIVHAGDETVFRIEPDLVDHEDLARFGHGFSGRKKPETLSGSGEERERNFATMRILSGFMYIFASGHRLKKPPVVTDLALYSDRLPSDKVGWEKLCWRRGGIRTQKGERAQKLRSAKQIPCGIKTHNMYSYKPTAVRI